MAQKDLSEKALIRKNDVFADIINTLLGNGHVLVQEENLVSAETETVHFDSEDGNLKDMFRDICKRDVRNGQIYAIFGIEDQQQIDYTMPLRCMGYDYDAYKMQKDELLERKRKKTGKGNVFFGREDRLAPVITLVLYYGKEWEEARSLLDMLQVPEEILRAGIAVPDYKMNLVELGVLDKETLKKFSSDFRIIAAYTRYKNSPEELRKFIKENNRKLGHPVETQCAVAAISQDSRYLNLDVKEGVETDMCKLYDMLINEGMERGLEQGMERGLEQGMERGLEQGMERGLEQGMERGLKQGKQMERRNSIHNIISLMHEFHASDKDIVQKLIECYQLTEEQARQYLQDELLS